MAESDPDILPPEEPPRRYPSTIGGALYVLVMIVLGLLQSLAAKLDLGGKERRADADAKPSADPKANDPSQLKRAE